VACCYDRLTVFMPSPRTLATRPTRVQLLVTCLVDHFRPDAAEASVRLLRQHGVEVEVPEGQTCCGQPAFNAGSRADAAAMARHTIGVLRASDAAVVVPSGSCADMVIHHAPALLADDTTWGPRAEAVAARTFELTEFLVDVLGVSTLGVAEAGPVAYHACCHGLRGLGIDAQPRTLIGDDADRVVTLPEADTCCGFGGLFAVKLPDISGAMLDRKCRQIEACGARTVTLTDVSCAMHIQGGLERRGSVVQVRHIAEVLAPPEDAT
jgi:L-lactate dehydrogenase complex protein LldE